MAGCVRDSSGRLEEPTLYRVRTNPNDGVSPWSTPYGASVYREGAETHATQDNTPTNRSTSPAACLSSIPPPPTIDRMRAWSNPGVYHARRRSHESGAEDRGGQCRRCQGGSAMQNGREEVWGGFAGDSGRMQRDCPAWAASDDHHARHDHNTSTATSTTAHPHHHHHHHHEHLEDPSSADTICAPLDAYTTISLPPLTAALAELLTQIPHLIPPTPTHRATPSSHRGSVSTGNTNVYAGGKGGVDEDGASCASSSAGAVSAERTSGECTPCHTSCSSGGVCGSPHAHAHPRTARRAVGETIAAHVIPAMVRDPHAFEQLARETIGPYFGYAPIADAQRDQQKGGKMVQLRLRPLDYDMEDRDDANATPTPQQYSSLRDDVALALLYRRHQALRDGGREYNSEAGSTCGDLHHDLHHGHTDDDDHDHDDDDVLSPRVCTTVRGSPELMGADDRDQREVMAALGIASPDGCDGDGGGLGGGHGGSGGGSVASGVSGGGVGGGYGHRTRGDVVFDVETNTRWQLCASGASEGGDGTDDDMPMVPPGGGLNLEISDPQPGSMLAGTSSSSYAAYDALRSLFNSESGIDPTASPMNSDHGAMEVQFMFEVADLLAKKGLSSTASTQRGHCMSDGASLSLAARCNDVESLQRMVLEKGVDVDVRDEHGCTGLIWAAGAGHHDLVAWLLDHGANKDAKNHYGWTALMLASAHGHADMVKTLLDRRADVHAKNKWGNTALMVASDKGHAEVVETLLTHGCADTSTQDQKGSTALMCAASSGHVPVIKALLLHGADIDITDVNGETALMCASVEDKRSAVECLLQWGANPLHKNRRGETAMDVGAWAPKICGVISQWVTRLPSGHTPRAPTIHPHTLLLHHRYDGAASATLTFADLPPPACGKDCTGCDNPHQCLPTTHYIIHITTTSADAHTTLSPAPTSLKDGHGAVEVRVMVSFEDTSQACVDVTRLLYGAGETGGAAGGGSVNDTVGGSVAGGSSSSLLSSSSSTTTSPSTSSSAIAAAAEGGAGHMSSHVPLQKVLVVKMAAVNAKGRSVWSHAVEVSTADDTTNATAGSKIPYGSPRIRGGDNPTGDDEHEDAVAQDKPAAPDTPEERT